MRKLGDAITTLIGMTASGRVRHEGQVTFVELAGTENVNRITELINKGCRAALDQSADTPGIDGGQRCPAANRLLVALYLNRDRAVQYDRAYDSAFLTQKFSRELTQYAGAQNYLLVGNRVDVPPCSIRPIDGTEQERIEVRWTCVDQPSRTPSGPRPTNEPGDAKVIASDKVTAESGEGDGWVSEGFALWVKDGDADPMQWGLRTPFYFGRGTKNPQFEFRFSPDDQISRDHFAILYLPNQRFCLRNNGKNGTVIVRGHSAVRLYTPQELRSEQGSAKIARLNYGDVIRLQAGPPKATRIVQMAFCQPNTPVEQVRWADSFDGINCAEVIEPVARRVRDDGPPEQYTLISGEQFLGSSITRGIKFAYTQQDAGFVHSNALALVSNFGELTFRWLRPEVQAAVNKTPIPPDAPVQLRPGDELTFGRDGDEIPATRVQFDWTEEGR